MLSLFNLSLDVTLDSRDDGAFTHYEADVTIHVKAAEFGKDISRIPSGDTDVSVMLVYWVWKMQLHCSCADGVLQWSGYGHQRES